MTHPQVVILGAGLSGLVAARQLSKAGIACVIYEKSRGVGGRMATRRAECQGATLRFDHGAGSLTRAQAASLAELIAPTSPAPLYGDQSFQHFCQAADLTPWPLSHPQQSPSLISASGINSVGKALAAGLDINLNVTVGRAHRDPSRKQWQAGTQNAELPGLFDLLITTIPPRQAAQVLDPYQGPIMPLLTSMQPRACWTLMLGTEKPIDEQALGRHGEIIDRVIAEHSKGRENPSGLSTYTIQAGREWGQQHAQIPAKDAAQTMLRELINLGWDGSGIVHQQIHRWLYAGVANPVNEPCLIDSDNGLICAGDWCLGNDIDSALSSGRAAAHEAMELLG